MKLLLDENLPHRLREEFAGHDVVTAAFAGLSGLENGELLARAATAGFDVLITNDRGLEYEQNTATLPIAVLILVVKSNTIEAIRPLYPAVERALRQIKPCTLVKVG